MPLADQPTVTVTCRVTDPPLQLKSTERTFRPNPTTVRFARAMRVAPGDIVFDIGCGIGPLAIKAALDGAGHVYAVDPVAEHCELCTLNAAACGMGDRVSSHQGRFFEPFRTDPELAGLRADVIVGDVSGIAHAISRALGWYSEDVPTGGPDGTDQVRQLLDEAPEFMKPTGTLYFAVALDLSDSSRILAAAERSFRTVANAFEKPCFELPLSEHEITTIQGAYPEGLPPYITLQLGRRPHWRGVVYAASGPR